MSSAQKISSPELNKHLRHRASAFTLIELLTVIAIMAILAAIIFPVYAQAKKSAYKSSDLSNMNSLRTALQLYKSDQGAYPPALLGYVGPYQDSTNTNGRNMSNSYIIPPNSIKDALYPRRVDSIAAFRPALDRVPDNLATRPYDPAKIEEYHEDYAGDGKRNASTAVRKLSRGKG